MRIHLITIITLITCMQVSGRASGQQVTLSLKDAPLETAFKAIERQTQYVFFFPSRVVKDKKPVTLELKQADFRTAMERILEGQGLTYLLSENSVIIKEAGQRGGMVEDIVVRGRVVDGNKKPLAGVTVKLKGSDVGAFTDNDGRFSLKVPNEDAVLLISSVGYISVQVRVGSKRSVDVSLVESTAQLKEVTVSTGYEKIPANRLVGSFGVVDSATIQRGSGRDLISRLDGVTPSLLFNKSFGQTRLQLRGISTLGGYINYNDVNEAGNPLIILDKFQYAGDLRSINPNDIESITVLTDAAATSIYGARGGNGVIVITSKSGNVRTPFTISINSNIQVRSRPDYDYMQTMNSSDFIDVERFLFEKGYQDSYLNSPSRYPTTPVVELLDKARKGLISQSEADQQINSLRNLHVNDDYYRYLLRNPVSFQNYLSISGGGNNIGYNISAGADNGNTVIKGPGGNNRYTFNSNVTVKPNKIVELQLGVNYINDEETADAVTPIVISDGRGSLYPYAKLADDVGNSLAIPYGYRMSYVDTAGGGRLLDWHYRPLDEKNRESQTTKNNTVRINIGANVKLTDFLDVDLRYQYTNQGIKTKYLQDVNSYYTRNLINFYTDNQTFNRAIPLGGILDQGFRELVSNNARAQLNFQRTFGTVHTVSALVAAELNENRVNANSHRLYGYDPDKLTFNDMMNFRDAQPLWFFGSGNIPTLTSEVSRVDKFVSLLGNVNYTYDSRYAVYLSGRRDGSNLLGDNTNNRWKPLWAIGGRWNIHNESFFNVPGIQLLALRATYGYSGNINNTITSLASIFYAGSPNLFKQNYALLMSPPNPDMRWEEVRTINFGMDYSVLKNRISGRIEYYTKKCTDLIAPVLIDPTVGLPSATEQKNAANIKTKGFDVVINSMNLIGDLSWNTTVNVSSAKSTITKYYFKTNTVVRSAVLAEGELAASYFAYRWAGLDPATGDPRGFIGKEISTDYVNIFQDAIGNQKYIGSSFPLFFGNMMNTFRYKGLEVSANVSFKANYYFLKPTISYDNLFSSWMSHKDYEKRWKSPGDEAKTNIPSMAYPANIDRDDFFKYSEVNYEKGDHIRLQDIRLSYNFSRIINRRLNAVRNLELYVYANDLNLMVWSSSKSGYDPDFPTYDFPTLRNYSVGLRVGL